ncbi:major facilitator superfamily domain-containing protein [Diaporthe sp. PMI_573]|nr:major facilitator superfamily domain-containing protein [Diaporthaceae sp. PMI_573]
MAGDHIAPALRPDDCEDPKAEHVRQRTLGNVRLRHHETNEIILIPTPSNDPNDPLNWPNWYKKCIAVLVCVAILMCNFLAAGPTVTIVNTTLDFFPASPPTVDPAGFSANISKVAYFFSTTALLQGTGNFIWVPLANKYGRRPVYVASYTLYLATAIWAILDHSYGGFLAARILMGFASGAAETIAPVTISDLFFLHERGAIMALYTSFLSVGVGFGMIIAGLITINNGWRVIYEVAAAIIGFILLFAFFAFPETAFIREDVAVGDGQPLQRLSSGHESEKTHQTADRVSDIEAEPHSSRTPTKKKKTYLQSLSLYNGVFTSEPLYKIFVRPFGLILLPPVLWAALVESVTIGFVVAVTSNVDSAFLATYNFQAWQVGLCFISACLGSAIGIPAGGKLGDVVADYFTNKNGGIREPEMRLPAILPSLITTPLALVLYGVGIQNKLHWMCPTIGLGLLNFSIVQATNIVLVYVIDAYRPVAGEVTLAVMGFKSLFGFLLSFYTNPWVEQSGYLNAYGAMAGISAIILILWVPLYVWGRRIRHATWAWPVISYVHWSEDREVGE